MERYNRLLRAVCTALTAALMAGCTAFLAVRAPGFEISWLPVYFIAAAAAALVLLGRRGLPWMIGCIAAGFVLLAILVFAGAADISAMVRTIARPDARFICTEHAAAGMGIALLAALVLGALFAFLLHGNTGAPFALLVMLAAIICALAVNENISLWTALPGLAAGVAAFALPGEVRREGVRPVLLVPALVIVLLAFVFVPAARTTWEPMEKLAEKVRSVVEDYIRFTEERLAFSINEEGYDHAGMIGDEVVAMLGGPANPAEDAVMRVTADANLLLRGTIKRTYTGYSWVDDTPKARYLYYDFTHRGVRNAVFNAENAKDMPGFSLHSAQVEMLSEGTSTLFVPGQMASFDMDLSDAVYYNSAGEIFLTREVEPGDSYVLSAYTPDDNQALIAACAELASAEDKYHAAAIQDYTHLPEGIDSRVYALAVELTRNTHNVAEKAYAIQEYLAKNYSYTLEGRYPENGKDFVSWFLLDEKQGYCSYFASAMTVLCRISGIPARYIEGYYLPANSGGETILSGKNAHAWVEVYLNGLGWVAFDPTARTVEAHGETPPEDGYSDHAVVDEPGRDPFDQDMTGDPTPSPTPDAGSEPDPGEDNADDPETSPSPSPEPQDNDDSPRDEPEQQDNPNPPAADDSEKRNAPDSKKKPWLWLLFVLLLAAIIALAVLWVKKRMADTDPLRMIASTRSATLAAMILYRANLTLLSQLGFAPQGGEAPEAFAARVCTGMPNPAYENFVSGVVRSRYSGKGVNRECVNAGREAYIAFLAGMRRSEKLRFHVRRVLHGLGDFENIP